MVSDNECVGRRIYQVANHRGLELAVAAAARNLFLRRRPRLARVQPGEIQWIGPMGWRRGIWPLRVVVQEQDQTWLLPSRRSNLVEFLA
jgi:hypothetical protein